MISNLKLESDEQKALIKARIEFNKLLETANLEKDDSGNYGSFLSVEKIQDETRKIMNQVGLCLSSDILPSNGKEYLVLTLKHTSGEYERSIGYLYKDEDEMDGAIAKVLGAVLTLKTRYMMRSILGIGRGENDPEKREILRNKNPYKQPYKEQSVQQQSSVAHKPLDPNAKLTLQHQKEILAILKSNPSAIAELCVACDVDKLGDIYDVTYDKVLAEAKSIAQDMGI